MFRKKTNILTLLSVDYTVQGSNVEERNKSQLSDGSDFEGSEPSSCGSQ